MKLDRRLAALGAVPLMERGLGDDQVDACVSYKAFYQYSTPQQMSIFHPLTCHCHSGITAVLSSNAGDLNCQTLSNDLMFGCVGNYPVPHWYSYHPSLYCCLASLATLWCWCCCQPLPPPVVLMLLLLLLPVQHPSGYEASLDPWLQQLWIALRLKCPLPPGVEQVCSMISHSGHYNLVPLGSTWHGLL